MNWIPFMIKVLNDPHGTNQEVWNYFFDHATPEEVNFIVKITKATEGRYYTNFFQCYKCLEPLESGWHLPGDLCENCET